MKPLISLRIIFFSAACLFISFCFSQLQQKNALGHYIYADKLFVEAGKSALQSDGDSTKEKAADHSNLLALRAFKDLIGNKSGFLNDSLRFHCFLKAGLLEHYFDSLPQAAFYYKSALAQKAHLPQMEDSFFFKPALFEGSVFYSMNNPDSAVFFYHMAEQIADKYPVMLEENERLWNRMGVLYYESGNYLRAKNYFEKAVRSLNPAASDYTDLLVNYKMNIASLLIKSEDYKAADTAYRAIMPFKLYLNEINHNLGIIRLRTGSPDEAIACFRKTVYRNAQQIRLDYNKAEAFSALNNQDSAGYYIKEGLQLNDSLNKNRKNASAGYLLKLSADREVKAGRPVNSLAFYRSAINAFYPAFNSLSAANDVPEKYSGFISFSPLFNTLIAKAAAENNAWKKPRIKII